MNNLGHEKLYLDGLFALACRHEGQSGQGCYLVPVWVLHECWGGPKGRLANHLNGFSNGTVRCLFYSVPSEVLRGSSRGR